MTAPVRILHCLRAPVGGLFRHVCDLAAEQSALGHAVGIVCAATGDGLTQPKLDALSTVATLGVHRLPMSRAVGSGDLSGVLAVRRLLGCLAVDILHGHGAKGGAYARVAPIGMGGGRPTVVYTPHGGSLHYAGAGLAGRVVMGMERALERASDGILFESGYAAARYAGAIGSPRCASRVVPNGVGAEDLQFIVAAGHATDLVCIGELRYLKGIDVLLDALALVRRTRLVTLTIVGSGPDATAFQAQVQRLGLIDQVVFTGAMPARTALTLGRALVLPSRAESLPYVLLEAGAGGLPIIATRVGGIADLVADTGAPLTAPGDAPSLAAAILDLVDAPSAAQARAALLRARIAAGFTVHAMCDGVLSFYGEARQAQRSARAPRRPISIRP